MEQESIIIGGGITIVVVGIRGDKVRLGIDAPKETPIHRKEVWEAIEKEVRLNNNQQFTKEAKDGQKEIS
jgi:carbon storage regulator